MPRLAPRELSLPLTTARSPGTPCWIQRREAAGEGAQGSLRSAAVTSDEPQRTKVEASRKQRKRLKCQGGGRGSDAASLPPAGPLSPAAGRRPQSLPERSFLTASRGRSCFPRVLAKNNRRLQLPRARPPAHAGRARSSPCPRTRHSGTPGSASASPAAREPGRGRRAHRGASASQRAPRTDTGRRARQAAPRSLLSLLRDAAASPSRPPRSHL